MNLSKAALRVLYEDNHLIGVYKPAGVLTQGDRGGDANLLDVVKSWLAERYDKRGQVFLGLLHRLDRPVSGVMLFAKTSKAASRLSKQFRERSVDKSYLARLEGVIAPPSGQLSHFHLHTEGQRRVDVREHAFRAAKPARLRYETRWASRRECVVAVQLETGRKHQIRAQFAQVGHPIVGDRLYGSQRKSEPETIALCAVRLEFAHPITGQAVALELPEELLPGALRNA